MNLKNITNDELLLRTTQLVNEERETTTLVLHHLSEIARRKLYASLAYSSLFDYCTKALGYTESQAQRRISAARLLEGFPQIEEKIQSGTLSLSALASAQTFFRKENIHAPKDKTAVLEKLENQSTRAVEKTLAGMATAPMVKRERLRTITATVTEIKLPLEENVIEKLQRLKDIWKLETFAEVVAKMAELSLEKSDPLRKALRSRQRIASTAPKVKSRYIPAHIRHAVWRRDQGKCQKCGSSHRIEIDHIRPFSLGGENSVENLRLLCFAHNQYRNLLQPSSAGLEVRQTAPP